MKKNKTTVLLAEDFPEDREVFEQILSDAGYDVVSVASGEAAEEKLEQTTFDVIVTDIHMQGKASGIAIVGRGILNYPKTKIIAVTGMSGIKHTQVGKSGFPGAHATLLKPVSRDELISAIEKALGH